MFIFDIRTFLSFGDISKLATLPFAEYLKFTFFLHFTRAALSHFHCKKKDDSMNMFTRKFNILISCPIFKLIADLSFLLSVFD